jgi:hypothetical protein
MELLVEKINESDSVLSFVIRGIIPRQKRPWRCICRFELERGSLV